MITKKPKPWERQTQLGEGTRAYDLFLKYHALGADRSCPKVAEMTGRTLGLVSQLCCKFKWVTRANKYDLQLLDIRRKAIEHQAKSEALIWAEREQKTRHDAYEFAEKLFVKANQMLEFPLEEEKILTTQQVQASNGEMIEAPLMVIRKPAKWNFKTMGELGELQDKMRRLALGVPTSRSEVNVNILSLSPDERLALARVKMREWIETSLEEALDRVLTADPTQDREVVREKLLAEIPLWFCKDYKLASPELLALPEPDEEDAIDVDIQALPLHGEMVN